MNKNLIRTLVLALAFATTLSGCAQLVTKTYRPRKGGTVKYTASLFMTDKNREKALELANQHCSPNRAVIMAEDNKTEFTGRSTTYAKSEGNVSQGEINQDKESAVYVHFSCGKSIARP